MVSLNGTPFHCYEVSSTMNRLRQVCLHVNPSLTVFRTTYCVTSLLRNWKPPIANIVPRHTICKAIAPHDFVISTNHTPLSDCDGSAARAIDTIEVHETTVGRSDVQLDYMAMLGEIGTSVQPYNHSMTLFSSTHQTTRVKTGVWMHKLRSVCTHGLWSMCEVDFERL